MLVPEAKYPSPRTGFLLTLNLTYHSPLLQNKTLKQRKHTGSIDTVLVAHGSFSSRAATALAEQAIILTTWESNSTKGSLHSKLQLKVEWNSLGLSGAICDFQHEKSQCVQWLEC